ncbi:EF-hand domain-containing protein [Sphingomonas sp. BK345]|uniref:EF-hand domain-containing protein n=1 Tax=Sphingomonas sp. BK345 TaxID=2586980 RepID=UPI00160D00A5|nr:EF-hand domain-containing protein [Sphingomonas sp. BK345]MBB3473753.1 Ca2+-binding EF-hand superfamily protein [Sphingomonas sp. BK345]
MLRTHTTLAAALVALLATPALTVAAMGQETRATATAKLDSEFAASDTNKDGYLSLAELEGRMAKMKIRGKTLDAVHAKRVAALVMTRGDLDKDGRLSRAESDQLMGAVFSAYDLNHDGKVDAAEAARARAMADGVAKGGAAPKK